jgi:hypothetical protein
MKPMKFTSLAVAILSIGVSSFGSNFLRLPIQTLTR